MLLYAKTPNAELARMLGMSVSLVGKKAFEMGLKKDKRYLSETNRKCALKSSVARNWKCKKSR